MRVAPDLAAAARTLRVQARFAAAAPARVFAARYALTVTPLAAAWIWLGSAPSVAAWVSAAVIAGFTQNALAILMHEGAHGFFARSRRLNDRLADWLVCLPIFNTVRGYREPHLAHHRDCCVQGDPYFDLYGPYRQRTDLLRGFLRDIVGITAVRGFVRRYLDGAGPGAGSFAALAVVQLALAGALFGLTGAWWAYLALWLAPLLTLPIAINRFRTFVEHFSVAGDEANRATAPTWVEYLLVAPYGYANHFEHHLMPEIPYYRLPALHRALEQAGIRFSGEQFAPDGYLRAFTRLARQLP
jgi:fatty acid desaturase